MPLARSRLRGHLLVAAGAVLLLASLLGCGQDDNPTGPASSELVLVDASVKVGDEAIGGETVRLGHHPQGVMRFEARLVDSENHPAPGYMVRVEYEMPGMGMMRHHGTFMLHDDGTHGDLVPHDGLYCFEDSAGEYGCHRADAQPGEYHYDFCGVDPHGYESNRMRLDVTLVR